MKNFTPVDHKDVNKFIRKSPSNSSELDPIPMEILHRYSSGNFTLLTVLLNCSLENGVFPDKLKEAFLRLLLKKINLDPIKKNYMPISNLGFVGKLIKNTAFNQINSHIDKHNLIKKNQSAYQEYHSTEITLIKVKSDMLKLLDNQEVTCLISSRFIGCFWHSGSWKTSDGLNNMFDTALKWIESHLTRRTQRVTIGDLALTSVCVLI